MARKVSQRFASKSPLDTLPPVDVTPLAVDKIEASPVPLGQLLREERTYDEKAPPTVSTWTDAEPLPPVDVANDVEPLNDYAPPKRKQVAPKLSHVTLEQLDTQWDNVLESLPPNLREKFFRANLSSLTSILARPRQKLLQPRGPFLPDELAIVSDRFEQLGHPLRDMPARTSSTGQPVDDPRAVRREQLRTMRRG